MADITPQMRLEDCVDTDVDQEEEAVDLQTYPPLDEPCVALYVKHLLAWMAEHREAGPITLRPAEPLPNVNLGTGVVLEKYRYRMTYARVIQTLKAACRLDPQPQRSVQIGTIDALIHRSPCEFRVRFAAKDAGATIECID